MARLRATKSADVVLADGGEHADRHGDDDREDQREDAQLEA